MSVLDLCKREVVTVRETDDIAAAAREMRERHVGYLVVAEADFGGGTHRPIGVLTDRDIVIKVVARNVNPRNTLVKDVMTRDPVVVSTADSLATALREMRRIGVRRMPVVGSLGELRGVLSLDDVLDAVSGEIQDLAGAVRNEQRIEDAVRS